MRDWIEPGSLVDAETELQSAKNVLRKASKRVEDAKQELLEAQREYFKVREDESKKDARVMSLRHLESGKCAGLVRDRDGWGAPSKCFNNAKPGELFCGIHVKSLKRFAQPYA